MEPSHRFRLYVAGMSRRSRRAVSDAMRLLEGVAGANIDVVDVFQQPNRAVADGVVGTPTLVRVHPGPECRIVGDLSESRILSTIAAVEP